MFLEKILDSQSEARRAGGAQAAEWERRAAAAPPVRDFHAALAEGPKPRIIAEIKRASPSKGPLRPDLDPAELARLYEAGGARALSVLTETNYFQGKLDDLIQARAACSLPVLRKDFLLEPWELYQARACGADAILLIVAILEPARLHELLALAGELGMAALVEVHDESELEIALGASPRLIGINNRNLRTFEVSLETTRRLAPRIPRPCLRIGESGFHSAGQLAEFTEVDAFLIGESLVVAADPRAALLQLQLNQGKPNDP